MAINKIIVLSFILGICNCKSSNYSLGKEFISETNKTRLFLHDSNKTNEIYINSFYGKDSIISIDKNLWQVNYHSRCGINCSLRSTTILKLSNDSIIQILSFHSFYEEFLESDSFEILDSTKIEFKLIYFEKRPKAFQIFENGVFIKNVSLKEYHDAYYTDYLEINNEIWLIDDVKKELLNGKYPIIDLTEGFKYLRLDKKWYLINSIKKRLENI